jgi:asparagine synthase (glutamine-hydrolysing)
MCGIAGFFLRQQLKNENWLRSVVLEMTSTLVPRGPDSSNIWVDEKSKIALGHTRLAIQDLSSAGSQPMRSSSGRFVISYNGEIYNFHELRSELEKTGQTFRGHSDTEVILASVEEWGLENTLQRVNGMFSFGLWDSVEHTLMLVRDRIGKKPMYYGWSGDAFFFASELKALRQHPDFSPQIDFGALGLFIQYSWVPTPYSIYQTIKKLPAGSFVTVSPSTIPWSTEPKFFWSSRHVAEQAEQEPYSGTWEEALQLLDQNIKSSVSLRMVADVDLGALLSGGIDSTTVVACMQALSTRPVKTFSIGFSEEKYDEAPYAKAIAKYLGTDHTEFYLTPKEAMDLIPELPQVYDEPFADSSQIPTLAISKLARQKVKVALSGDGGDENFAGYTRYGECLNRWNTWGKVPLSWRRGLSTLMNEAARTAWETNRISKTGTPLSPGNKKSFWGKMARKARWIPALTPMDLLARRLIRYQKIQELLPGVELPSTLANSPLSWPQLSNPIYGMSYLDFSTYLIDDILVKVDRASMSQGLEIRCPLLDYNMVEFAWHLPMAMKFSPKTGGKYILKQLLQRYVPLEYIERPKKGFALPVTEWIRGPLRDWAEELLNEQRIRNQGFFSPKVIQHIWRQHLSGWQDHDTLIWSLLMFQAWHEGTSA